MSRPHGPPCDNCGFSETDVVNRKPYDQITERVGECPRCGMNYVIDESDTDESDDTDDETTLDGQRFGGPPGQRRRPQGEVS